MTLAVAAALTMCFSLVTVGQAAANNGAAELELKSDLAVTGKPKIKKKSVKFNHAKHQEKNECAVCHHGKGADGKQAPYKAGEEGKCNTCHNKDLANAKLVSFEKVAHKTCKGCHKKMKVKVGKTKGTSCKFCHNGSKY